MGEALLGEVAAGESGDTDENRGFREAALEFLEEGNGAEDFADANSVQPNAAGPRPELGAVEEAETFGEAAAITRVCRDAFGRVE